MCHELISARHACSASPPRAKITIVTQEGEERAQPEETNTTTNERERLSFSQTDYSSAAAYCRCSVSHKQPPPKRQGDNIRWRARNHFSFCRRRGKNGKNAARPDTCFHSCFKEQTVSRKLANYSRKWVKTQLMRRRGH